jgi:hypothetical protein
MFMACIGSQAHSQPCSPLGNQTSYGTGNTWIGYVYSNRNLTNYAGYVTAGTAGNPNFDVSFGGDYVNYATNGCSVYTESFSIRYKLRKTFAAGNYEFTVGGDDGYRLSIDGGSTWLINRWNDQPYTTTSVPVYLNGSVDLVLEYYEDATYNRISFSVASTCMGAENQSVYGTGDVWRGYVYDGTNFNAYKGMVLKGTGAMNAYFDENFGGDNVTYNTSSCAVNTETFSVRYRLRKNFPNGTYVFLVGADDGYRLSLDGGATWVINGWSDHGYNASSYTVSLNGTHDLVLEFYENVGANRVSFDMSWTLLPIHLVRFTGETRNNQVNLNWTITESSNPHLFVVERSADGKNFTALAEVKAAGTEYRYTDIAPFNGLSFYRLKMVDDNGLVKHSDLVSIKNAGTNPIKIFQSGNTLYVRAAHASLYDLQGKRLQTGSSATNLVALPMERLAKGVYAVQVDDKALLVCYK